MYQNKEKENNLIYYWTFWPQDSQLIAQNLEGIITLTYVYLKHNLAQRINIKEEKTARLLSQVLPCVDETWLNGKGEEGELSRLSIDAQNEKKGEGGILPQWDIHCDNGY